MGSDAKKQSKFSGLLRLRNRRDKDDTDNAAETTSAVPRVKEKSKNVLNFSSLLKKRKRKKNKSTEGSDTNNEQVTEISQTQAQSVWDGDSGNPKQVPSQHLPQSSSRSIKAPVRGILRPPSQGNLKRGGSISRKSFGPSSPLRRSRLMAMQRSSSRGSNMSNFEDSGSTVSFDHTADHSFSASRNGIDTFHDSNSTLKTENRGAFRRIYPGNSQSPVGANHSPRRLDYAGVIQQEDSKDERSPTRLSTMDVLNQSDPSLSRRGSVTSQSSKRSASHSPKRSSAADISLKARDKVDSRERRDKVQRGVPLNTPGRARGTESSRRTRQRSSSRSKRNRSSSRSRRRSRPTSDDATVKSRSSVKTMPNVYVPASDEKSVRSSKSTASYRKSQVTAARKISWLETTVKPLDNDVQSQASGAQRTSKSAASRSQTTDQKEIQVFRPSEDEPHNSGELGGWEDSAAGKVYPQAAPATSRMRNFMNSRTGSLRKPGSILKNANAAIPTNDSLRKSALKTKPSPRTPLIAVAEDSTIESEESKIEQDVPRSLNARVDRDVETPIHSKQKVAPLTSKSTRTGTASLSAVESSPDEAPPSILRTSTQKSTESLPRSSKDSNQRPAAPSNAMRRSGSNRSIRSGASRASRRKAGRSSKTQRSNATNGDQSASTSSRRLNRGTARRGRDGHSSSSSLRHSPRGGENDMGPLESANTPKLTRKPSLGDHLIESKGPKDERSTDGSSAIRSQRSNESGVSSDRSVGKNRRRPSSRKLLNEDLNNSSTSTGSQFQRPHSIESSMSTSRRLEIPAMNTDDETEPQTPARRSSFGEMRKHLPRQLSKESLTLSTKLDAHQRTSSGATTPASESTSET